MVSTFRRTMLAIAGLSVTGLVLGNGVASSTAAPPAPATVATNLACNPGQGVPTGRAAEYVRDGVMTAEQARRADEQFRRAYGRLSDAERHASQERSGTVRVSVYVHAIQPKKGSVKAPRDRIEQQIRIMNRAYRGDTGDAATATKFHFALENIDRTVNKRWYHAALGDEAAKNMKRTLYEGKRDDLNLYFSAPESDNDSGALLGWARFPSMYKDTPKLDGVVINVGTMKNGRFDGYNKGDTAVHEVGHWLGLFHTFQGACSKLNDRVSDTPREASPNYVCPKTAPNSCSAPGRDPIHNFMDYSYDRCLDQFTPGQVSRMNKQWAAFRAR